MFFDDCVFTSISQGVEITCCKNKNELRDVAEKSANYFKERNQKVKNIIIGEDQAVIEIDYHAI